MEKSLHIEIQVGHEREGQYITVPFRMPAHVESVSIAYKYERHQQGAKGAGGFTPRQKINTIDLGLLAPDGTQVGASGSDKSEIQVSATFATPGYRPTSLVEGELKILLGAYKVASQGVMVSYDVTFTPKRQRLFKGDLHVHTLASDGVLSTVELAQRALRHGLDFVAITDHNQMITTDSLPHVPGVTLIPGIEWTHFKGHANFLGVDRPYDEPFFTNEPDVAKTRFSSARERGALIVINHPFEEECPFQFDLNALPFDCIEIWNGPMRESNLRSIGLWQSLLSAGRKIPACGGSDYHCDQLFIFPGGPTTCVYSWSNSPADLLDGLKNGHAFITFAPDGASLDLSAGEAIMGDSVPFSQTKEIQISAQGLQTGDVVQVVTAGSATAILKAEGDGSFQGVYKMEKAGFGRVEILRSFIPGLPLLPALISNPIYFDPD